MLALGVTGDVGAGKSTLTRFWKEMGASVLDADDIVRSLWKRPHVIGEAVSRWGRGVADTGGNILPGEIASRAFSSAEDYAWLCGLLHPLVRIEMERMSASLEGWVVAEIPLLFEGGVPQWIDATVYLAAPEEKRRERNSSRGWTAGEIIRRESFLLPSEEKKRRADVVLENAGTLENLRETAEKHALFFRRLAGLVRCTVTFQRYDDALLYRDFLRKERLGTDFDCLRVSSMDKNAEGWLVSFISFEHLFAGLSRPHVMDGARGPYMAAIRRMPYKRRIALSEELAQ
ncbi:Dephospho-CoA kinase [bioreactor metagenome]|jgi:dephospho-CoA kinase|uniref:Dephospho-CoA kinase n=1 Tax=bioreactor metagenome TaxID=1076179 RepID=A0A644Z1T0_9ZZZZ|nr:dephospho-CoA kinase [Aminivibrio sp.]MDD3514794.1 dephospho-CoA kinase [Synergistaceae bacterium]MEA4953756.1 dephospho-CoA kinase [Aminivibrio sp.]NCB15294.1 dephospho-CoA kinase [Synergistales bacterium]HPF85895.1 dephospho-CoA kinase [Aminivibrio sp.]